MPDNALTVESIQPGESSAEPIVALPVNIVSESLAEARSHIPEAYRRTQQEWLRHNLGSLLRATEILYQLNIRSNGPEVADAALQGALLGCAIIRRMIGGGIVELSSCIHNLDARNIGARGMFYDGDMVHQDFVDLYGEDGAAALEEIQSPIARTLCGMTIGLTLLQPR
jgi:hypothetical protein